MARGTIDRRGVQLDNLRARPFAERGTPRNILSQSGCIYRRLPASTYRVGGGQCQAQVPPRESPSRSACLPARDTYHIVVVRRPVYRAPPVRDRLQTDMQAAAVRI